jgi:hypothetical protein
MVGDGVGEVVDRRPSARIVSILLRLSNLLERYILYRSVRCKDSPRPRASVRIILFIAECPESC